MKIAELKVKKQIELQENPDMKDYLEGQIIGIEEAVESLSQKIAEDVAGCQNRVRTGFQKSKKRNVMLMDSAVCKDVKPGKKCSGCKRLLEWGKKNL